jgi:hypothetical protein
MIYQLTIFAFEVRQQVGRTEGNPNAFSILIDDIRQRGLPTNTISGWILDDPSADFTQILSVIMDGDF